ncbi:DUF268 domain-containing protein [Pseudomonadales bacterium]|nr:DUF268 domain-containing protein [Pseudomonadales bacterium]
MLKQKLIKIHWILCTQLGFNPRILLRSLSQFPKYINDWRLFRKSYTGDLNFMPCLHDRYEEGGVTSDEYFWQDLLVARWIFSAKPKRHVDVGSRVDGFVAHVASFREIEVFDVRPNSSQIPGVVFKQADLMSRGSVPNEVGGYCDSLSCLHALEHFGLGRYGDPIDPLGHERGLANMVALLQPGGTFYLSTPIGKERVEFNANYIFNPRRIIQLAENEGLTLMQFTTVGAGGMVQEIAPTPEELDALTCAPYNLGIFVFTKSLRKLS